MLVLNAVKLRHNYLSVLFEGRFWYQACLCLIYLYCRSAVDAKLLIICLFFLYWFNVSYNCETSNSSSVDKTVDYYYAKT